MCDRQIRDDCETCQAYGECVCMIDSDVCWHPETFTLEDGLVQCVDCLKQWRINQ